MKTFGLTKLTEKKYGHRFIKQKDFQLKGVTYKWGELNQRLLQHDLLPWRDLAAHFSRRGKLTKIMLTRDAWCSLAQSQTPKK